MAVVVELLDRSGRHIRYFRFFGGRVVIGRSPDCDVILADPHVDPHHLEVTEMPLTGALSVRDLDTVNGSYRGVFRRRRRALQSLQQPLESGELLTLGRTRLRISSGSASVAPALKVSRWESVGTIVSQPWFWGVLAVLAMMLSALDSYYTAPVDTQLAVHWLNGFYPLLGALLYAAFWSFIARSTGAEPKLSLNFALAVAALVLLSCFQIATPFVLYNFDIWYFGRYIEPLLSAGLLFAAVFVSLASATHLPRWGRAGVAIVGPLAISLPLVLSIAQRAEFNPMPEYNRALVAPDWQLRQPVPIQQFLDEAATLAPVARPAGDITHEN